MAQIAIGDAFETTIQTMEEYVDEVQKITNSVFEEFEDLINEHPWEIIYDTASKLEEVYNTEVLAEIQKHMENWENEEGSYVAVVQRFKMGQEAEDEARRQQDAIVDKMRDLTDIVVISELALDFTNTHFDLELVRKGLESISDNVQNRLPEIVSEKQTKLTEQAEENEIVKSIVNIGILYGESISSFVIKAAKEIHNLLDSHTQTIEAAVDGVIDDAEEQVSLFTGTVEDSVASMRDFIEDLFADE